MANVGTAPQGKVLTARGALQNSGFLDIGSLSGLTNHGVIVGQGTSAFVATAVGTTGQILMGNTGADPSFQGGGTVVGQTITGNTGGAISPVAGNWDLETDNATVVFAGTTGTETLNFGITNLLMGSDGSAITTAIHNVGVGFNALNALTDGARNTSVGYVSGLLCTQGTDNTLVGYDSGADIVDGDLNTFVGSISGHNVTTGGGNTAIGYGSLQSLTTGSNNIVVGSGAITATAITGSSSSNVIVGSPGAAESNTIRIGNAGSGAGQQNRAFVAGITGVTVAASAPIAVDTNGQISSLGFGTATNILTSNGAGSSPTWQAPATVSNIKITTYNTSDSPATWTKDVSSKVIEVYGWAGGGGAGSGRKGTTTAAGGGGGGGAGGSFYFKGNSSSFNTTESVTIGAGGTGGASQTSNANNGNPGATAGGNTSFGNMLCLGGAVGVGGTTTTAGGGAAGVNIFHYSTSAGPGSGPGRNGAGSTAASNWGPAQASNQSISPGGGGGGGGADAVTERVGGLGSNLVNVSGTILLAGGAGGLESTGINGVNGNIPLTTGGVLSGGSGGGGGGGYSVGAAGATTGGTGGIGAIPGGGGGGGGGGIDAVANSGAGGNGGNGRVIVVEYF